jgi:hypothetical protein
VSDEGFIRLRSSLPEATIYQISGKRPEVSFGEFVATLDDDDPMQPGCEIVVTGLYEFEPGWLDVLGEIHAEKTFSMIPGALFYKYPPALQQLCEKAHGQLQQVTRSFIHLVRWRLNPGSWTGDRSKVRGTRFHWSRDGREWNELARMPNLTLNVQPAGARLAEATERILVSLSEAEAPLGREVWHAAAAADEQDDPRTSIILSVSAVEIELKRFIGEIVPQAEWLVMNLPTPPIVTMIVKYLPTLEGYDDKYEPPKNVIKSLGEAVSRRNTLVHVGTKSADRILATRDEAQDSLNASSDMLWLFDVYRGHRWALNYLTPETQKALKLLDAV